MDKMEQAQRFIEILMCHTFRGEISLETETPRETLVGIAFDYVDLMHKELEKRYLSENKIGSPSIKTASNNDENAKCKMQLKEV